MLTNIPTVKLGIIAVSRACFIISLSERRRAAVVAACQAKGVDIYECKTTVENEKDMLKAVDEVKAAGCNALVVFLGNFGPETPETLIAQKFDGPVMYAAAAEETGKDLIDGRGDAYCGMLNCSYNLGMRHLKAYIPEYPVGTAEDIAAMIQDYVPIARALIGLSKLKIITFGPRPQDFFAALRHDAPNAIKKAWEGSKRSFTTSPSSVPMRKTRSCFTPAGIGADGRRYSIFPARATGASPCSGSISFKNARHSAGAPTESFQGLSA